MTERRTIYDVLAEARRDLGRVTPAEAYEAARQGAVLVDVRSEDERRRQGVLVPGALHYPLSVVYLAARSRRSDSQPQAAARRAGDHSLP